MGVYCDEVSIFVFFSSRRRHTRFDCDWSSDVCSSDLRSGSRAATECPSPVGGCEEEETMNVEGGTRNAEQQGRLLPSRDLRERTKAFALDVIRLVQNLPRDRTADVIGHQLLRAGTSVAANYRSARRARYRREFLAKMGIVEEEADESSFWLELLVQARLVASDRVAELSREAGQLVAITVASIYTARGGRGSASRSAFPASRSAQCSYIEPSYTSSAEPS